MRWTIRRLLWPTLAALAACGPYEEPIRDLRVEIAEPDPSFVDFVGGEAVIEPGKEAMLCFHMRWDGGEFAYQGIDVLQGKFGHHAVLLGSLQPLEPGTVEDCTEVASELLTLPDPSKLATENPAVTEVMREREKELRASGKKARRRQMWVGLQDVAPHAVDAVIVSEDAAFWMHEGVDYDELRKVLREAWEEKQLGRGASTISQQLAKNLWLGSDRSLLRKAKELILARRMEKALGKKRILALYLNVAEWGDGVYGIEAGAREHFGVSARSVTLAQGAVLAAMLPAPRRWTPRRKPPVLRQRALRIVDLLEHYEKVSPAEAATARADIERLLGKAGVPTEEDSRQVEKTEEVPAPPSKAERARETDAPTEQVAPPAEETFPEEQADSPP